MRDDRSPRPPAARRSDRVRAGRYALRALGLLSIWVVAAVPGQAQITVRGQVRLPGGQPAADIEVRLLPRIDDYQAGRLALEGRLRGEPAAKAVTASDGSFALDAPAAGMWRLHVAAEGYRPMEHSLLPLLESTWLPPLVLTAEVPLRVRVLGANGEPAVGAHVAGSPPAGGRNRLGVRDDWRAASRRAFADSEGIARLGRAPREVLHIYAHAPGHREGKRPGVDTSLVTVRLEEAALFEIEVVGRGGQPMPGALARLGERRWPLGPSDESGRLRAPVGPQSTRLLEVLGPEGERVEQRLDASALRPDRPKRVTLPPTKALRGRILDAQTGLPLTGAFAWVSSRAADFTLTDASGSYSLSAPVGSDIWIWGAAPGYLGEGVRPASDTGEATTVSLQRAERAQGVVVDGRGRPIAGAEIEARIDPTRRTGRTLWGARRQLERDVSTDDGRFSIGSLDPRVAYYLRVAKPGFATTELPLPDARGDAAGELRIVLEAGRVVTATVVGPSREPIAGARIELSEGLRSGTIQQVMRSRWFRADSGIEASTDSTGRFVMADLAAGTYTLAVSAPGYATARGLDVEILEATDRTDLGELVLEPGAPIQGRVLDPDGSPLEGARIVASGERSALFAAADDDESAAHSGADGFFAFTDRQAGERVDLQVRMPGFATGRLVGVEAPTPSPVEIELERPSRVSGRVVDEAGRPVANAQVGLRVLVRSGTRRHSGPGGSATSDEEGAFVIEGVDPGEATLTTAADGYVAHRLTSLAVEPGKDLNHVRIVLEPGATLSGSVTGPSGQPVASADLRVMLTEDALATSARHYGRTDGEGRYRLEGLPPGRRSLSAYHEDYEPVTREVELEVGDNRLILAFEGGAELSGRVVDTSGSPVGGAEVSLESEASGRWRGSRETATDSSGTFAIQGISEGSYSLHVQGAGYAPRVVEDLEVGPAGLSSVDVVLEPGLAIVGRLHGLEEADYTRTEVVAIGPRARVMGVASRDGTYRIDGLSPDRYDVSARVAAKGLATRGDVEILDGVAETVLDLEFGSGPILSGQVLRGGEPLAGVNVSLAGIDVTTDARVTTDHDGRFELRALEAGRHRLSVGSYPSGLNHHQEIELTRSTEVVVRVATAAVSGRVLDATDWRPVSGASVRLEPLDPDPFSFGSGWSPRVTSDSDGGFEFAEASVGAYRLVAQRQGYAAEELAVTVSEDLDQTGLELLLTPTEGLLVDVRLPSGRRGGVFFAAVLDASGRALMTGTYNIREGGTRLDVPTGTWELVVSAPGAAAASVRVSVPSEPITVALGPEAVLSLRIPDLETDPTLATARLTDPSGRGFPAVQWMRTGAEWPVIRGRAVIQGLPPGTWTIRVTEPGGRVWRGQTTLVVGENPEVVLE